MALPSYNRHVRFRCGSEADVFERQESNAAQSATAIVRGSKPRFFSACVGLRRRSKTLGEIRYFRYWARRAEKALRRVLPLAPNERKCRARSDAPTLGQLHRVKASHRHVRKTPDHVDPAARQDMHLANCAGAFGAFANSKHLASKYGG
jgi:hypothetical protein